jgi:hypothetical protein
MAPAEMEDSRETPFGVHTIEHDAQLGAVDIVRVADSLASQESEREIRVRVGATAHVPASLVAPIHRVEREGGALKIITAPVEGIRLSDLLDQLEARTVTISERGMLDLTSRSLVSLAALHTCEPAVAHGAIAPAHVVLTTRGVVFTDSVFGGSLSALQWSNDRLWNTFQVAVPKAAGFDQRTDVTQLAAVVLALALRRPLRADEYPGSTANLVIQATETLAARSALRMWLQQALQLHARAPFASAIEAARAFSDLLVGAAGQRAAGRVVRTTP